MYAARWFVGCVLTPLLLSMPAAWAAADDTPLSHLGKCGLRETFSEDFHDLSISAWGNGRSRWIAHTPWAGDFGDAAFSDPAPGFPFSYQDGMFRIEARKDVDGHWRSGLLASVDSAARGFAQQYGYFEMKAKLPPGPGLWPAFWLATAQPRGAKDPSVEIDVLEHYGAFPSDFHSVVHIWDNSGAGQNRGTEHVNPVPTGSLYSDFHTYGVDIAPDWLTFYFDRKPYWMAHTPAELRKPMMLLVDLALGAGWPIDQTPSPSVMQIAYVKAYKRDPGACH